MSFKNFHYYYLSSPTARDPEKATSGSGCWDLFCDQVIIDSTKPYWEYRTGVKLVLDAGQHAFLLPRSSISKTGQVMCNAPGFIDNDYTGEIIFRTYPVSSKAVHYTPDQKVCQLFIVGDSSADLSRDFHGHILAQKQNQSARKSGGFGSTGI